jgi:acyl-CoA reductase-like NAD-dependent aldehyde dehydrogenase
MTDRLLFVGGEWTSGATTVEVVNPATGSVIGTTAVADRAAIDAALDSNLSNALIESTNTKIRLLTRIAYGFHGPEPLIALAMLSLGGNTPTLPGRNDPQI